jgi:hypothetical protein
MRSMLEKRVEPVENVEVRASNCPAAKDLAAEFLPLKTASQIFEMAAAPQPIKSDFRVVRACSIWKS